MTLFGPGHGWISKVSARMKEPVFMTPLKVCVPGTFGGHDRSILLLSFPSRRMLALIQLEAGAPDRAPAPSYRWYILLSQPEKRCRIGRRNRAGQYRAGDIHIWTGNIGRLLKRCWPGPGDDEIASR